MIKKPLLKKPAPEPSPVKKLIKKRTPEPEAEADGDGDGGGGSDGEGEAEAEEPPRRTGSGLKKKKKKEASASFADVFDSTKPGRGTFPVGEFTATVSFELIGDIADEGEEQGELKVVASFVGSGNNDEEVDEKKIGRQQYMLCDDEGVAGPGIPWLKGDLDILGYEDILLADLEEIFADTDATGTVVVIKNVEKGGYVNSYIQGLAEGD